MSNAAGSRAHPREEAPKSFARSHSANESVAVIGFRIVCQTFNSTSVEKINAYDSDCLPLLLLEMS